MEVTIPPPEVVFLIVGALVVTGIVVGALVWLVMRGGTRE